MRDLDGRQLHSRVKGRHALERRLRALLIAVHRYPLGRALAPDDRRWAARTIDGLTALLHPSPAEAPGQGPCPAGETAAGFAQLSNTFAGSQGTGSHDE